MSENPSLKAAYRSRKHIHHLEGSCGFCDQSGHDQPDQLVL
jgi:hypothetical protein